MSRRPGSIGPAAVLGCAALLLDGWAGLLVPSLVRQLEADFGQSDAGVGAWFFGLSWFASRGHGRLSERTLLRMERGSGIGLLILALAHAIILISQMARHTL